ncbi:galanin receptor 2b-like [Clytia hemisphaerica]|uniref:galanin receptor 2b-like n=1 Tax=Clytia hemisphaerica TaxID=252671 RepID=UPI0034D61A0F
MNVKNCIMLVLLVLVAYSISTTLGIDQNHEDATKSSLVTIKQNSTKPNGLGSNDFNQTSVSAQGDIDRTDELFFGQQDEFDYLHHDCRSYNISLANCTCEAIKRFRPKLQCSLGCRIAPLTRIRAGLTITFSLIGVIGNAFVLVVRIPYRKRLVHFRLITVLAAADLVFSFLFIIKYAPQIESCTWPYGLLFCKLSHSLLTISFAVDVILIFIIAVERYYGIVYMHRETWSKTKWYLIGAVVVLICAGLVIPFWLVYVLRHGHCTEDWTRISSSYTKSVLAFSWILFLCFFLVPILTISILHARSLCWLHRTIFGEMLDTLDDITRDRFLRDNRRIMTILIAILVSFTLFVGPSHVISLYYDYYGVDQVSHQTRRILRVFSDVTYAFHVAANPVVYSLVDPSFRKGLQLMFKCNRGSSHSLHQLTESIPAMGLSNF